MVCYINAYVTDAKGRRGIPVPASFRKPKYVLPQAGDSFVDLAYFVDPEEWPDEELSAVEHAFLACDAGGMYAAPVYCSARMHHQRDRKKGRPLGSKASGAIFTYEALEAGQQFTGSIAVRANSDEDVLVLIDELKDLCGTELLLGRSRRAGYGGLANIALAGPADREFTTRPAVRRELKTGELFRVLLLSDYVGRDPATGQHSPAAFEDDLLAALQRRVKVVSSHLKFGLCGGFNQKARLPVPLTMTMAAGSVLILRALEPISPDTLIEIEAQGLGERLVEGYGRFVFWEQPASEDGTVGPAAKAEARPPETELTEDEREILKLMQERMLFDRLATVVLVVAQVIVGECENDIPASLIGRLRVPLRTDPRTALSTLAEWLDESDEASEHGLRKPARDKLKKCKLNKGSLWEWLKSMSDDNNHQIGEQLRFAEHARKCYLVSPDEAAAVLAENAERLRVQLIDTVLSNIARAVRRQSKGGRA
jgi:CRISPR-associated protein Csx10